MREKIFLKKQPSESIINFSKSFDFKLKNEMSLKNLYLYWNEFLLNKKLPSHNWVLKKIINLSTILSISTRELNIFQFYSLEFITSLAHEIKKLKYKKIIEVGSGSGFLSYFLKKAEISIISSDDFSWKIPSLNSVEKLNHMQALKKYNPEIVLISWENYKSEVAIEILEYSSVKFLIWIGESKGGCTGSEKLFDFDHKEITNKYYLCKSDSKKYPNHSKGFIFTN